MEEMAGKELRARQGGAAAAKGTEGDSLRLSPEDYQAARRLRAAMEDAGSSDEELERQLWELLKKTENREFSTLKGLLFTYQLRGGEMFVSRKTKSITRASVRVALAGAREALLQGREISGPRALGAFGAPYLFAIFREFGLLVPKGPAARS